MRPPTPPVCTHQRTQLSISPMDCIQLNIHIWGWEGKSRVIINLKIVKCDWHHTLLEYLVGTHILIRKVAERLFLF